LASVKVDIAFDPASKVRMVATDVGGQRSNREKNGEEGKLENSEHFQFRARGGKGKECRRRGNDEEHNALSTRLTVNGELMWACERPQSFSCVACGNAKLHTLCRR